jgi:NDP-sugar pyrophosphorylase family protein
MNDRTDDARRRRGFLTANDLAAAFEESNSVLDPHSVLISTGVTIGAGNVFYPNVVIERSGDGVVAIGDNNVFYPGVYVLSSVGSLMIGDSNEFGPGGCTIKANVADAHIAIGSGGRYHDGANIMGETVLGDGSQVLGNIIVQGCTLAGGGTFQDANPDERAAVLKGFGLARGIALAVGQVINGSGNFADAPVEQQRSYHPAAQELPPVN